MRDYVDTWILNDDGEPVPESDPVTWARWHLQPIETRRVGYDVVDGIKISTVFVGVNLQIDPSKPPLLWETLISWDDRSPTSTRYPSREDAEQGHRNACDVVGLLQAADAGRDAKSPPCG